MNKFGCTESIDLTDDDVDLFESLLDTRSHTVRFPKPLKPILKDDSSLSVLETLKSIQRENPQVETIFLDSDEDEDNTEQDSSVQSATNVPISNRVNLYEHNRSECDTQKSRVPPPCGITQKSNLMVREFLPSDNITLQNANKIALKSTTKPSSAARFLVIPQEVLPILVASKGPVALNIPGMGPLVIPNPSQFLQAPTTDLQVTVNPENAKSVTLPGNKTQKRPETPEYDPLCDAKYHCWLYRKRIKRDLDGFSLLDRLGFYKAEQRRSKLCVFKCEENVKQLQYQIAMVQRKLNAIQDSKLKSENVDRTKKSLNKHFLKSSKVTAQIKSKVLNPVQKKNLDALLSWQEHFQSPTKESSPELDDLLVTKKVVILQDSKTHRGKKQKIKHTTLNTKDECISINKNIRKQNMKTVNSALNKSKSAKLPDRFIQKHIKRKVGRPRKFHKLNEDITPIRPEPIVKQKGGRPKKLKVKDDSLLYDRKVSQIRPCHVELSPVEIKPEVLERYEIYRHKREVSDEFSHKVIENLKWFQNEIDSDKPILVVNEVQCSTMNLTELCHSNNIVYPVSQISDLSAHFLTFISPYNVKFVKPEIMCQYLSGRRA